MSKDYTQYDWASDRLARLTWEEQEERIMNGIDRRMRKNRRRNERNS